MCVKVVGRDGDSVRSPYALPLSFRARYRDCYGPEKNPLQSLNNKSIGNISVYAQNKDYHKWIKGKLKNLAGWIVSKTKGQVKVFVDTAPLMEKPLAEISGIGWIGKHTNLVSRDFGSWLFLGVILLEVNIINKKNKAYISKCGTCSKCLEIKGDTQDADHTCDENNVKSAEIIKKDTKACPKCGTRIFKIYGCNQMWCTGCNTAFNWATGAIYASNAQFHNPHYVYFLKFYHYNMYHFQLISML